MVTLFSDVVTSPHIADPLLIKCDAEPVPKISSQLLHLVVVRPWRLHTFVFCRSSDATPSDFRVGQGVYLKIGRHCKPVLDLLFCLPSFKILMERH